MDREAPAEAAELFRDPEWRAAARYRAGQFDASASALSGLDTPDANYNRGNALARAGKLQEAIDAYDRTLELDPSHEDAEYNRELVAELLEQQPPDEQPQNQDSSEENQNGSGDSESASDQGEDAGQESEGQGQEQQESEEQGEEQQSGEDSGSEQSEQDGESEPESSEGSEQQQGEAPLAAAASPEEVEDWADEQAADQWLRRIPQDPGGLLRRKFLYQYQQYGRDQDGNQIFPGGEAEPW